MGCRVNRQEQVDAVEREIQSIYHWWHVEVPGVTPREEGRLEYLWKILDFEYDRESVEAQA